MMLVPGISRAQVMEQNPAPLLFGDQQETLATAPLEVEGSTAPIGVDLSSIAVVAPDDDVPPDPHWNSGGIDLSRGGEQLHSNALAAHLQTYLGRPLSERLLNEIRVALVRYYRAINQPFVTVTIPPQDVTQGTLRVVVTRFTVGEVQTRGNDWTPDGYLRENVGLGPGSGIASDHLIDDLNWLNLNPYRNLGAVFEAGQLPGTTNILLNSEEQRPWTIYAGQGNSGAPGNGRDRVFLGFNLANLPFLDHQLAYKFTFNPESLGHGDWASIDRAPGYASHAASYFAPLTLPSGQRVKLHVAAGYAEDASHLYGDYFDVAGKSWSVITELALPLRIPRFLSFEAFAGPEVKRQDTTLTFGDLEVLKLEEGVAQVRGGVRFVTRHALASLRNDVSGELGLVVSPGGIVDDSHDYVYGFGSMRNVTHLRYGFAVVTTLSGQMASDALPGLEKFTLGGNDLRGYDTNELVGDSGVLARLELQLPQITVDRLGGFRIPARIFGFYDAGYVWDRATTNQGVHSFGIGMDLSGDRFITMNLAAGYALADGPETRRGDFSLLATFTVCD